MLHTHEVTGSSPVVSTMWLHVTKIEDLCNGSTPDSDSVCGGSNPSSSAKTPDFERNWAFFLFSFPHHSSRSQTSCLHPHFLGKHEV